MARRRIIITGASGFIGRRLLADLKRDFDIVGLARRSQSRCGAPVHDRISWYQTDIAEPESLATAFRFIRETGGADYLIHLAAHYDFTGEDHPEYQRTNVDGLRLLLGECRTLGLRRFIFASSLAACRFPPPGRVLTEESPPDGDHVYAWSKREGERLLAEFESDVPSVIVRLAAIFSDWCEYAPLHVFIETWLGGGWRSRLLGGRGDSAVPYLHAREIGPFIRRLIACDGALGRRRVVIASPNHTTSHRQLYELVRRYACIDVKPPVAVPAPLARFGVWGRDLMGRLVGDRPFERPWMVEFIDRSLEVDASRTNALLDWRPRTRLLMDRRMAFLLDHRRGHPREWMARNRAAFKEVHLRPHLQVFRLLERHQDEIRSCAVSRISSADGAGSADEVGRPVLEWRITVALRHILNSVRAQDRGLFLGYCRDFAEKRYGDGVPIERVVGLMRVLSQSCLDVISRDPEAERLEGALFAHVVMTVEFGCDQVIEVYEDLSGAEIRNLEPRLDSGAPS